MVQEQVKALLERNSGSCFCFECKPYASKKLEETLFELCDTMGIITAHDRLYESFSTIAYLRLFAGLHAHKKLIEEALDCMQLHDLAHVKIARLTPAQKMRVAIAREMIRDMPVIFIEEPLSVLDEASVGIVLRWMEAAMKFQKQLFLTSHSLKDICLMPGEHYTIDAGLQINVMDTLDKSEDKEQPLKISAKLEDKVLLFDPKDIDYIESLQGKSYLHVHAADFQCSLTMDELEQRLRRFGFYRSHRSYLVNLQKVKEITRWTRNSYSLKLEGLEDEHIPLSKGRAEEMKDLYDL